MPKITQPPGKAKLNVAAKVANKPARAPAATGAEPSKLKVGRAVSAKAVSAKAVSAKAVPAKPVSAKPVSGKAVSKALSSKPVSGRSSPTKLKSNKLAPTRLKSGKLKPWSAAEVHDAFSRFRRANPEPKGELEHLNPYTLLVAVVLSAQATDAGVNKATRALFPVADTPHKMVELGEERLRDYIKTIGLYRTKARNVIALSEKLIRDFGGVVPRTREELESLPGAGRKTANVVLNMAFGEHTMAVDTHVFRVGNRTNLAPGNNVLDVELELERVIPDEFMMHAHHWLILHGRYTCLARKPRCEVCLINDLCRWPEKTLA